jgi:hypothetical protein
VYKSAYLQGIHPTNSIDENMRLSAMSYLKLCTGESLPNRFLLALIVHNMEDVKQKEIRWDVFGAV